jgi:lipopolysaccharide export LptBFGC system permease protein LptF
MEVLSGFSDDQIALAGCAIAFVAAGFLMTVSYYIGNRGQNQQQAAREQILTTARQNAENVRKAA